MTKTRPSGPTNAKIMLVGEAPGAEEEREGVPFVGQSGKFLREFLMKVGIDPTECYMTNVVKYRPPRNDLSQWFDKGIPNQIVIEGLAELQAEIARVRPNIIVALGNFPGWALGGMVEWNHKNGGFTGITDYRGSMYPCRLGDTGTKMIYTYHPSYIMREGMQDHGTWLADLTRVREESEFPELRYPNPEILVFKGDGEGQRILNPVDRSAPIYESAGISRSDMRDKLLADLSKTLTIDIEYINRRLLCVGMTTSRHEAAVFTTDYERDEIFVREILLSGIPLNAQNAAFEASILEWHYGMPIMKHVAYDTMLAAHAANIELPKDLGYLTSIYTRQPYHKGMVNWDLVKKGKQDLDMLWKYNGIDVWTEHAIMEEQLRWDLDDPLVMDTFRHEMALLGPLWEMSKRGILVDTTALESLRKTVDQECDMFQNMLDAFAGQHVNVKSGPQVSKLLFERLNFKPVKKNKTGPATDDKTLAALLIKAPDKQHETVLNLIRNIRNRRDLVSKFLDVNFDADNRARGHYNPGGTNTGRLSSSKFYPTGSGGNQQNIPRDERIRNLYIPDRGFEFAYADLERAESLIVAHIAHDPRMLADHAPGTDAHSSLASMLFNKPQEEVTKDERFLGKKTRHAGNYMQGPRTFQMNVNQDANKTGVSITFSEAKKYIEIYKDIHPGLKRWWQETEQTLYKGRTLYNLLGRKRTFYGHIRSILPEAVAFVPQSTVGDVLNVGLLNVHNLCAPYLRRLGIWDEYAEAAARLQELGFQALNQVHDAIGYQYPLANRFEVNNLVRKLLSVPLEIPKTYDIVRIPVEIAVGPAWGSVKVWAEDLADAA